MYKVFAEVVEKCQELEQMRIIAQTAEIMYRQKGEPHTAERFKKVEVGLAEAINVLKGTADAKA